MSKLKPKPKPHKGKAETSHHERDPGSWMSTRDARLAAGGGRAKAVIRVPY